MVQPPADPGGGVGPGGGRPGQVGSAAEDAADRWPGGVATGVGSLPGTQPREAVTLVAGELPELPHLPELPNRGPGADLVGRTAGLLALVGEDFAVETTPLGWRIAGARSRVMRRAASWLDEDLDALQERFAGYTGLLKVAVAGPWTMAAQLELRTGERAVRDVGACRDLAGAVAEAIAAHVADVRRRVPHARLMVQLDEPSLPAVVAGSIATASGLSRYPAIDLPAIEQHLGGVLAAAQQAGAVPVVHSCAGGLPWSVLWRAGAAAVSVDLDTVTEADHAELAECVDAGLRLVLGVVPAVDGPLAGVTATVGRVQRWWRRLGLDDDQLAPAVALSPSCGLAHASPAWPRRAYGACRAVARALRDEPGRPDVAEGLSGNSAGQQRRSGQYGAPGRR
ncbi:MAG: methionine synthase [Actinomycetota bacterium]|nr:MAG: methionine synthase [Actinomycetota bacterium]